MEIKLNTTTPNNLDTLYVKKGLFSTEVRLAVHTKLDDGKVMETMIFVDRYELLRALRAME